MTAATPPSLPAKLEEIIEYFEMLPESEKRQSLIAYAGQIEKHHPPADVEMDLTDIRRDQECADTVGVFLKFADGGESVRVYLEMGPEVQTLTRALGSIICEGVAGAPTAQVLELPPTFVPRLVGAQLFRQRSQTVYYVLTRVKNAINAYQKRRARGETGPLRTGDGHEAPACDNGGSCGDI